MSSSNDLAQFSLSPFGKQLIQSGYVSFSQMQQVLFNTRKSGRPLTDVLAEVTGKPVPGDLLEAYKQNERITLKTIYGVDFLMPETPIDLQVVEELFESFMPFETCRHYRIIPLKRLNSEPAGVIVGMVNPNDAAAHDALNRILVPQRLQLKRLGMTPPVYDKLIEQCLERTAKAEPKSEVQPQPSYQALIAEETIVDFERTEIFEISEPDFAYPDLEKEHAASPISEDGKPSVVPLVSQILLKGLENKASEIYLDPQKNGSLQVRFRQDGVMALSFNTIRTELVADTIARLKTMAELDPDQSFSPQRGRIKRLFAGQPIDFWLTTSPSSEGEKAVLKIFNPSSIQPELESSIVDRATLETVKKLVSRTKGLIVVTGTPGSGKTTTLYSLVSHRQRSGAKISTVEAPIERSLSDITQIEVSPDRSLDRASLVESCLEQDIDVMLVDRIEDPQTARAAIAAIRKGCLVLTGVTAEDAPGAIAYLEEMGIDAATLAEVLVGVINGRLVRRVCPVCHLSHEPTQEELMRLGISGDRAEEVTFYKAKILTPNGIEQAKAKGMLCRKCSGKGYQGQMGVYEVLEIGESLKTLISQQAAPSLVQQVAKQEVTKTLEGYALELIEGGQTTLEELDRVLPNFPLVTEEPTQNSMTMTPSTDITRRLQIVENLLLNLTEEFARLKQELASSQETAKPEPVIEIAIESPIYEELKPSTPEQLDRMLDAHKETMISEAPMYEELRDPGTWTDIKREFETDKETVVADIPFMRRKTDESANFSADRPKTNKQLPDPW